MGKTKTAFIGQEEDKQSLASQGSGKNKTKNKKVQKGDGSKVHISGLKGGQRVKMVAVSEEVLTEPESKASLSPTKTITTPHGPKHRSKKYIEAKAKFNHEKKYKTVEAVRLIKESSYSKFDGTVELHLILKKTSVSTQVTLPFQAGRQKKIEVADEKTIEKLKEGKIDFDILISTTEMMPKLVPFAKILGPKGLMPNPKNGTLVSDIKKAKGFSTATITIKTEKEAPLVHTVIGRNSQEDKEIVENAEAVVKALGGSKQIVRAFMKSTMSPSVKLAI